ncbi:acyl-CoA thioesterase [Cellvibrio sp.]|uniref:acyl-CoA thioesterase n=1 Tax=Cellvibrio sp. TaxID=1965322 RepID=UPI003964772C
MSEQISEKPFFSCEIPVRWGDMDAFGHVNNTIYFRYFEETRFQWMLQKGIPIGGDSYPVVVTIGCTFFRPVFHPDTLRVDVFISEPGRSSFMATYKVYTSADHENPCSEGYSKIVWVDKATGKSVALPDAVRAWF